MYNLINISIIHDLVELIRFFIHFKCLSVTLPFLHFFLFIGDDFLFVSFLPGTVFYEDCAAEDLLDSLKWCFRFNVILRRP